MRYFFNSRALILGLFALILSCCNVPENAQQHSKSAQQWKEQNGKIKTLSTIAMIGDLVSQIGGDAVDNLTLIQYELDPHSYQLVKGDNELLDRADVVFFNGLSLEHGPSLQRFLLNSSKAVSLGDSIAEKLPDRILYVDLQPDPHIWMDIALWMETVPVIVEALVKADPDHEELYRHNGQRVLEDMFKEHESLKLKLLEIPQERRYLVTSHDAFQYFARSYLATRDELRNDSWKQRFAAPEGLAPDVQLSTADIQQILDYLIRHNVHVIFPESNVSKDSIRKLMQAGQENGIDVRISEIALYGDAMGRPGSSGDTYLKMIRHNVNTLVDAWSHE